MAFLVVRVHFGAIFDSVLDAVHTLLSRLDLMAYQLVATINGVHLPSYFIVPPDALRDMRFLSGSLSNIKTVGRKGI